MALHQNLPSAVPVSKYCTIGAAATALRTVFLAGKTNLDSSDAIDSFDSLRKTRAEYYSERACQNEESVSDLYCGSSVFA